MKQVLIYILSLLLVFSIFLSVVGCTQPDGDSSTQHETNTDGTEDDSDVESGETSSESDTNAVNEYEDGDAISGAGFEWSDKDFASSELVVNESGAAEITWSELSAKLTDRNGCKSDEVYLVSEKGVILPDTKYYGNGCTVIFTGGIEISGVSNAVIKEMIKIGRAHV